MATAKINKKLDQKLSIGFTLVELMIVVVIIAVISLIAYPSYTNTVRKTKRTDALKGIQTVSNRLEKFMTYCNVYIEEFGGAVSANGNGDRCSGLGISAVASESIRSENNHYSLNITCLENCMAYKIDATAQGSQLNDTNCQTFTYTSRGEKTSSNSNLEDSTGECWK